jgi:pimeloyl-ACP methyl ester carboxylesterase
MKNEVWAMKLRYFFVLALLVLLGGITMTGSVAHAAPATSSCAGHVGASALTGTIGGANYKIEVPANWNGTLALYSHGYVFPGPLIAAPDVGDPLTGAALLSQGYALAGSSYSQNGWALQQAFQDQIALLDFFDQTCGQPTRTIAWGHSLGGIITAGLVQLFPNRFDGALPMCGVLAGGVGTWNQALDGAFAFNVLLAGNSLPIVNLDLLTPQQLNAAFGQAEGILSAAQNTPQGRARIALLSALGDTPGWFTPLSPEPAANDFAAQEANQFLWASKVDFAFIFFARAELEARAGGNPSWNTDVNYREQLEHSADRQEVEALYKQAGLSLNSDLNALNHASRIAADPQAVSYLNQFITFDGDLDIPVLSMHTTGDGLVVNQDEQAYKSVVDENGDASMLRQVFVHRAGHCSFTPAETLAAFQTLINRLNTGRWENSTDPTLLNQEATALGPSLNVFLSGNTLVPTDPAFIKFRPTVFLRPFNARAHDSDHN